MAINQNHLFEELDGVKCAVVEKNVVPSRVAFLKGLLEGNGYTVVVVGSPPPKAAAAAPASPGAVPVPAPPAAVPSAGATPSPAPSAPPAAPPMPQGPPVPPPPETFTVGVTDVTFNATNAVFGRLLRTKDGHVVTLAYWQQKEEVSHDEVPYFEGPGALT